LLNFYLQGEENAALYALVFDGTYSKSLPAGVYTVGYGTATGAGNPVDFGVDPATVRVVAGETRTIDFRIDTGIR